MNKFFLLALLFFPIFVFSQKDIKDSVYLSEVNVIEKRIKTYGFKQTILSPKILANFASSSLSEIIQEAAGINIKSYGKGGLASSSIRGASAANTQVIWNGVALNSPMLGQFNLTDLSANAFNEIRILHGGSALVQNSGALGGTIMLRNIPNWQDKISFKALHNSGSIYNHFSAAEIELSNYKLSSQTRINTSSLSPSQIAKKFRFTSFQNNAIQENLYFKNSNSLLSGHFEYKKIRQKLPSLIENNELINNDFYIAAINFKHFWNKLNIKFNSSIFRNSYIYKNKMATINSINNSWSQQNNLDFLYSFKSNNSISIGINTQNYSVQTNNYDFNPQEFIPSFYTALNWTLKNRLAIFMLDKISFFKQQWLPSQPSIGMDWKMNSTNTWHSKISAAQNYRRPTLNDRYWKPGGNPKLKSEKGYSYEIGQLFENKKFKIELSYFFSKLKNRIIWLPQRGNFWQAINFDKVVSNGIELFIKKSFIFKKIKIENTINYTLNNSYSIQNKQKSLIPFIAPHQLSFISLISIKNWFLFLNYNFTSKRNISESNFLNPQNLFNLKINKKIKYKKTEFNLKIGINNLLNIKVETMPGYYIEPLNFNLSLNYSYHRKSDQH